MLCVYCVVGIVGYKSMFASPKKREKNIKKGRKERRVKDRFHLIKYLFICLNFERLRQIELVVIFAFSTFIIEARFFLVLFCFFLSPNWFPLVAPFSTITPYHSKWFSFVNIYRIYFLFSLPFHINAKVFLYFLLYSFFVRLFVFDKMI